MSVAGIFKIGSNEEEGSNVKNHRFVASFGQL